ncbi:MAG: hypothetical protein ACXACC_03335 [Promethearchaeota archaeon]|jgi:hypothetical protein
MVVNKEEDKLDDAIQLEIFIFWLKISFGIIGGILHYIIQRILYEEVLFYIPDLLRGFILFIEIFVYISLFHILFYLIIKFSKTYFTKEKQVKFSNWRLTLKSSGIFFTIFLISASLSFYIGF